MVNYADRSKAVTAEDLIRRYNLDRLSKDRKAISVLNDGLTKTNDNMKKYIDSVLKDLEELQDQVDGNITTWFFNGVPQVNSKPSNEWKTEDEKINHLGDLYYDQDTGYAYRWAFINNTYEWSKIVDSDVVEALALANAAKDTADSKRRTFYTEPKTPYDSGDIWIFNGEIYRCIRSRDTGDYNIADWINDLKYTDDTVANKAIEALNNFVTEVTTHYVTNKILEETKNSISSTIKSIQIDVNEKNKVFSTQPVPPYQVGDIWIQNEKIYVCINAKEDGAFSLSDFRLDLDSGNFATKTQIEQTDSSVKMLVEIQSVMNETIGKVQASLDLKVGRDDYDRVVAMLNASADVINIKGKRFNVDSELLKLTANSKDIIVIPVYSAYDFTDEDSDKVWNYIEGIGTLTPEELIKYDTNNDGIVNGIDHDNIVQLVRYGIGATKPMKFKIISDGLASKIVFDNEDPDAPYPISEFSFDHLRVPTIVTDQIIISGGGENQIGLQGFSRDYIVAGIRSKYTVSTVNSYVDLPLNKVIRQNGESFVIEDNSIVVLNKIHNIEISASIYFFENVANHSVNIQIETDGIGVVARTSHFLNGNYKTINIGPIAVDTSSMDVIRLKVNIDNANKNSTIMSYNFNTYLYVRAIG